MLFTYNHINKEMFHLHFVLFKKIRICDDVTYCAHLGCDWTSGLYGSLKYAGSSIQNKSVCENAVTGI